MTFMNKTSPQWFRLDNAAKIYPASMSLSWNAMFRMSATLKEDIDVALLEIALKKAMKRFPSIACRLIPGLFWYRLQHQEGTPPIRHDVNNPMGKFKFKDNNHFLFIVRYYKNRIAVEFFHAATDGYGGLCFMLSLVREYLIQKHGINISTNDCVLSLDEAPKYAEMEDSFLKYARKETIGRTEKTAYHPSGKMLSTNTIRIISSTIPSDELLSLAKKYKVKVGVLLSGLLLMAIANVQKTEKRKKESKQPVKVSVPVNLRQFYRSKTLRNFSSYINPGIESRFGDYSLEEILVQVKSTMDACVTEKQMNARFSENVAAELNLFIRIVPLFLKNPILKFVFFLHGDRYVSTTISNLGNIDVPVEMSEYIERLDFIPGRPFDCRTVASCISYGGNTFINFTRTMKDPIVERYFFNSLVELGVHVFVESNNI